MRKLMVIAMAHIVALQVFGHGLFAQNRFEIPLTVTDGVTTQVLYFGILPGGHFCIDPSDSINGHREFFLPPSRESFDARFVYPRGNGGALCFDQGSWCDYRPFTSPNQADTFKVKTYLGVGSSIALSWPSGLSAYFPNLHLRYVNEMGLPVFVDMLTDTSVANIPGDPATILITSAPAAPQSRFEIPLIVTDGVITQVLYFGILPGAHFCIDPSDSINGHVEWFIPVFPPGGVFDARFVYPRSGVGGGACFDQGSYCDFRPFISETQKDTFRVKSQLGMEAAMIFSWPPGLASYFEELTLRYFNGSDYVYVNMLTSASVDVTSAGDPATVSIFSSRLAGPGPSLQLSPPSLAFGGVPVGGSATLPVTAANFGTVNPLTITGAGLPAGYSIVPNVFPIEIPPLGSHIFNVTFSPPVIGQFNGDVLFSHNGPGNMTSLPVTGRAIGEPPFEVPLTITDGVWGDTLYFGILPDANFCIVPTDGMNGHFEFILPPCPPVSGVFDARFTWPRNGSDPAFCFDQGSYCDFRPYLSVVQMDTFKVRATRGSGTAMVFSWPAGLSAYFSQLTLRYFNGASTVNLNMLAETSADLSALGDFVSVTILAGGLPSPFATCDLSPRYIDFGYVAIGDAMTLPVTVTNRGTTDVLSITGVVPPAGYAVVPNPPGSFPLSVGPGASRRFDVTFSPSAIGPFNGYVVFTHNAAEGDTRLPVTGTGTSERVALNVPLIITDGQGTHALHFGILPDAHFCIVPLEGVAGYFENFIPPPPPVGAFDARFVWPRSGSNLDCFDQGSYNDFRPYISGAQRDTFKVRAQFGQGTAMIISWPTGLAPYFDQLTLRYFDGNGYVDVNMLEQMYADITSAGNPGFAYIYATGRDNNSADVGKQEALPARFALYQNYPNPFNPSTRIVFGVPSQGFVSLRVFDVLGREVATLVDGVLEPGEHSVEWRAQGMSSGVYIYRLTTTNRTLARTMLLLR